MNAQPAPGEPQLTEEQFQRLATYGRNEFRAAGDTLYATGDTDYDLFLLQTAAVEVIRDSTATEPEHLVYRRSHGDFLGELNLLTGQAVYLTARVSTPGEIVRLDAAEFRRVLNEQSDIADVLLEALRVRRHLLQMVAMSALEIIGAADASDARALRTFAARLELPHTALDPDSVQGLAFMAAHGLSRADLPAAVVSDRVLRRATPADVANAIGLAYRPSDRDIDLVVLGAGPAGLASAVYGASEGLVTVLLDATSAGGQAAASSRIENYLGFPRGVSGEELTRLALAQAMKFGAQLYAPCTAVAVDDDGDRATVHLADGSRLHTQAVIVATGAKYRRLPVPRLAEFEGRGNIRYSATELDARGCESLPVTVVGGANSAGQAALFLASRGSRVDLVIRRPDFSTMSEYLSHRLLSHPKVRLWTGSEVTRLHGEKLLTGVGIRTMNGASQVLESVAVFCFIGADPDTDWLGSVARDEDGFILTDQAVESAGSPLPFQTSSPRIFAAGDVRSGSMKRVASAVGEGASAVASVHKMLAAQANRQPVQLPSRQR